jgi:predicted dehydrogenase
VEVQPYTDTYEEFHLAYRYGEEVTYPLTWEEPLKLEVAHFLECIHTGKLPRTNGMEGLRVIQVLEAAQKSLMNGGTKENILWS